MRTILLSDTCRWLVEKKDAGVVGGVITLDHRLWINRPPYRLLLLRLLPLCKQESVVVATIAQASAIGNLGGGGGVNNLQRFEAYDPLALKGGGDPMVAGHCWLVKKDTGANAKRKENQSSSSFGKKEKTSVSYGFQRWGHDYQGQGRVEASS